MTFYESKKQEYQQIVNYLKTQLESGIGTIEKQLNRIKDDYYVHYFPRMKGESEDYSCGEICITYESAYETVHTRTKNILDDFSSAINTTWNKYSTAKQMLSYYTIQVEEERAQRERELEQQRSQTKRR